jgi:crotonobetainyl-CoA:carnitine CoA-transferase CaiB-like acyl-CoA transferase
MTEKSALAGLRVIDLSNLRTGAQASQLFADFGADVIHVERPGGSPLRAEAAWPFLARGKRSLELDLHDPSDLQTARRLCAGADVVIETFRPGVAERLGLGYDELARANPRLVYASITGFGRDGPFANLQGYEGIILAKMGVLWTLTGLANRPGPAFPSAAYAAYPASQLTIQGILAALYERETSGLGQRVETSLAQALTVQDPFNWFCRVAATKFEGSFTQTPRVVNGIPSGGMPFRLLVALTKDGRWLQFSQTVNRLFRAMMELFELDWMFDDPKWKTAPDFDDVATRVEFWEILLAKVRAKTADEWLESFETHPNVWGERFNRDNELLWHPQMVWNRMVADLEDAERGAVRQPGPLTRADGTPASFTRPAPRPGEYDAEIRAEAAQPRAATSASPAAAPTGHLPLAGLTAVEFASYYAAPFGLTLLGELGMRIIKLEELTGDPQRNMLPFPEVAGLKALLGKESVAVDLQSEKGREIARRIVAKADVVLQSYRAGVGEKLGLDADSLRKLNPDLIYLRAPGYGEDGPCGRKPAFAPTIGAAAGLAWRNAGASIPTGADLPLDVVKAAAMQLGTAVMGVGNADAISASSAATAMMLGLLARKRGAGGQKLLTSMLSSVAHSLAEVMVEYEGKPPVATSDAGIHGFNALYRLYETGEEWVFLAAPSEREWRRLTGALGEAGARLAADPRFADIAARKENDEALDRELEAIFRTDAADAWERRLCAVDVACVVAARGPVEANYMDEGSCGQVSGYVTTGNHPILGEMPQLKGLLRFSRCATVTRDAGLVGQDTQRVLGEFGYGEDEIKALSDEGVILIG